MSASTPLFRKKLSQPPTPQNNLPIQRSSSNASQYQLLLGKQKSFDTDISIGGGYSLGHDNRNNSCSRPRPPVVLSSSLSNSQICRSQSFAQKSIATKISIEAEEEDSMHEKYLAPSGLLGMPPRHGKKSVESTPLVLKHTLYICTVIQQLFNDITLIFRVHGNGILILILDLLLHLNHGHH